MHNKVSARRSQEALRGEAAPRRPLAACGLLAVVSVPGLVDKSPLSWPSCLNGLLPVCLSVSVPNFPSLARTPVTASGPMLIQDDLILTVHL